MGGWGGILLIEKEEGGYIGTQRRREVHIMLPNTGLRKGSRLFVGRGSILLPFRGREVYCYL